ncbi:hypothetical protein CBER1_03609 [Cercospora berteroae]|uniref:Uncharacterized protein n=1 Tax=Cercospora berteroae TaxID=357750 RepID=A0A2S6C8B7_9PEZI|nr:hypothetical protein CBER1_03609 [Cercospora berteroae]
MEPLARCTPGGSMRTKVGIDNERNVLQSGSPPTQSPQPQKPSSQSPCTRQAEEAKWIAFVECSESVEKKHASIKEKFQEIDVLQKHLRSERPPFGRKREVLASDQELFAHELRPEGFEVPVLLESEYGLEPALQERTPKKNNAYTKTLERAGQVIEFWRDLYSDGFSENLEKYADLSDAIWELVGHDQAKASSLLASATRAPLAAAAVAGQVTPTAATLENGLLQTTLQTRTRSASTEGDSADALAPDVTPAP